MSFFCRMSYNQKVFLHAHVTDFDFVFLCSKKKQKTAKFQRFLCFCKNGIQRTKYVFLKAFDKKFIYNKKIENIEKTFYSLFQVKILCFFVYYSSLFYKFQGFIRRFSILV